jgi:hypothetical protein
MLTYVTLLKGDVSAKAMHDYDGMIKEGEELAIIHEQIVVLPNDKEGAGKDNTSDRVIK